MSETEISQQYCVRWNSHLCSLSTAFPQLLDQEKFVDVTLACEGQQVHCHKVVLAACSQYFENLLSANPCKHPIIILPSDIKLWTIQALVEFMYKGQVNVSQAGLPDLVKSGDLLQIRGLCNTDITAGLTLQNNNSGNTQKTTVNKQSAQMNTVNHTNRNDSKFNFSQKGFRKENETASVSKQYETEEETNIEGYDNEDTTENEDPKVQQSDFQLPLENQPTSTISSKNYEYNGSITTSPTSNTSENSITLGRIRVKPIENLFENYKDLSKTPENQSLQQQNGDNESSKNNSESTTIEIVSEIYKEKSNDDVHIISLNGPQLPSSLRFNRNVMDISVKLGNNILSDKAHKGDLYRSPCEDSMILSQQILCTPNMEDMNSSIEQFEDIDEEDSCLYNDKIFDIDGDDECEREIQSFAPIASIDENVDNTIRNIKQFPKILPKLFMNGEHNQREKYRESLPLSFALRNPRGNQTRSYTEEQLVQALNDVKAGVSIYKASQKYRVPRKTLRNWMKRWKIKSAYPMPIQLQRAAEKRKEERDQLLASISVSNELEYSTQ